MTESEVTETLRRSVLYERDADGGPLAIEVVTAPRWVSTLADVPPEHADVRVVLLEAGRAPQQLPEWLGVEAARVQAAELGPETGPYVRPFPAHVENAARRLGVTLRPPTGRRAQVAEIGDFIAAGAAAVRHPAPVPADFERRREVVASYCRGRGAGLSAVADRTGIALEWWLVREFETPEAFVEALLLERVRDEAPQLAAALLALQGAVVPDDDPAYAELALDRRALLSQASPWRYVEGADMTPALAALRAWLRRYTAAFEAHAATVRDRASVARARVERELRAARALERLDSIRSLGGPVGTNATLAFRAAIQELAEFEPTPQSAPLGKQPPLFEHAEAAAAAVRVALEHQRERLAGATVGRILDQTGADALAQLLAAFQATNLDGIERALDARLAAHIEGLLGDGSTAAARQPLGTA